jgi:tetratricopeptide (TPR) repeat protein
LSYGATGILPLKPKGFAVIDTSLGDWLRKARAALCLAVIAAIAVGGLAAAAPFVPADDDLVLESGLPTADPRMREMRALASELAGRPDDMQLAMRLAARQLAMGVAEADPRFIGYAQATVARWWQDRSPPALLVFRARILQAQHRFVEAAADLHLALQDDANNLQALLVLASIDEVTGELDEARRSCEGFAQLRPGLAAAACIASVQSLTGHAASGYATLSNAVKQLPSPDRTERIWALTILAEIAIRNDDTAAEEYLREALALNNRDVYVLTTYADYLLDRSRTSDVVRLLTGFERIDALYLRLVLAMGAAGDARFTVYRDVLSARFAAARRQGDRLHLRDASRFALEVEHDGPRALDLARQNWVTHKAPADARALLAAAVACRDPAAARPVAEWVAMTHLEDRTLWRLLEQLGLRA